MEKKMKSLYQIIRNIIDVVVQTTDVLNTDGGSNIVREVPVSLKRDKIFGFQPLST